MSFISEGDFFVRYDEAEEIVLREYQSACIDGLRANIRSGVKSQILASMVGSGKTICAAYLLRECWQKGKRGIFVVDRLSLLGQTSAVLDRYGIPHGIVQASHSRYRPNELIQVASIHTVKSRGWPKADLIIADECHVTYATMLKKIERNDAVIIGLTATPFTRGLGKHYKALVNVTTGNKLTKEGYLVPFRVWAAKEPDMTGAKVVAGEWTDEEASTRSIKIIGDVVKEYQNHGGDRKSIVFGCDVKHCEELQRQFLSAGINMALCTYLTGDEEREMMLTEFRKPHSEIRGLISVAALSRGFDVPDVGCIIMCRPLKSSFAEFIQILGRGLRSHPSKENCTILDLAGNFMRHYPAMMEFFEDGAQVLDDGKPKPKSLKSIPAEKKPKKCPKCSFVFVAGSHCPSCGYIFTSRSTVQHEEGSLSEFDGATAVKMDRASKQKLFAELRYICHRKGYKDGWSSHAYKNITGVWPAGFRSDTPLPPSAATLRAVQVLADQRSKTMRRHKPAPVSSGMELDLFE